jgi:hypothetical protein
VEIWHNISVVTNYFERMGVPLIIAGSDAGNVTTIEGDYDFRTGEAVNVTSYSQADVSAAFAAYAAQLQKYPDLNNGMFLPDPVPEDLVMPFGQFAKKYNLTAAIPTMYNYNPGLGDILTGPTVEQMRVFGLSLVSQLSSGFLTTAHHNNSELYTKAQTELLLDSSLLLNSEVVNSTRSNGSAGIELVVNTPDGQRLIKARKLLIAIPTRVEFLAPFDLSHKEKDIFGKLIDAGYYTSIVKNTGIPDNMSLGNFVQDSAYNLPKLPGVYNIQTTGVPGLHLAFYGTPLSNLTYPMSDDAVKADIIAGIKKVQEANSDVFQQTEPEFVVYSSHAPFYLQARPEDTKNGFYDDLYSLQGERNTYWTGASFRSQDSSDIWRYTENEVFPYLLAGL